MFVSLLFILEIALSTLLYPNMLIVTSTTSELPVLLLKFIIINYNFFRGISNNQLSDWIFWLIFSIMLQFIFAIFFDKHKSGNSCIKKVTKMYLITIYTKYLPYT